MLLLWVVFDENCVCQKRWNLHIKTPDFKWLVDGKQRDIEDVHEITDFYLLEYIS